jgi:hypothetical protein
MLDCWIVKKQSRKVEEYDVSFELLSQLLAPRNLRIDESFDDVKKRMAFTLAQITSVNISRADPVINDYVGQSTAYVATFAWMAMKKKNRMIDTFSPNFRLPSWI